MYAEEVGGLWRRKGAERGRGGGTYNSDGKQRGVKGEWQLPWWGNFVIVPLW